MARVTVEDCLGNIKNRFDLVICAAKRARALANGADTTLEWQGDKSTVMALREAAEGLLTTDILDEEDDIKPIRASFTGEKGRDEGTSTR